jgi:hypothetical protein
VETNIRKGETKGTRLSPRSKEARNSVYTTFVQGIPKIGTHCAMKNRIESLHEFTTHNVHLQETDGREHNYNAEQPFSYVHQYRTANGKSSPHPN